MKLCNDSAPRAIERLTSANPNYSLPDLDIDIMDVVEDRLKGDQLAFKLQWNLKETDALGFPKGKGLDATWMMIEHPASPVRWD